MALESCINPTPPALPESLVAVTTPLNLSAWAQHLAAHPDYHFTQYILNGIAHGFRIGFSHASHKCTPALTNHPSANEHPQVITDRLQLEAEKGRLIGPLDPLSHSNIQVSSLGAVPKKHSSSKWRLILDLSHPKGSSVNDGITRSICSLSYMKVEDVVNHILHVGRGAMLAKIDIENAFRHVPVHPHDRHLLGMIWNGQLFVDTVLPFGLRSAPKIFNCIADALQWMAHNRGVTYLEHFLDDYITCGAPNSDECQSNLRMLTDLCKTLNLPLAMDKLAGPTTEIVFLGILIDTVKLELRLPPEKLHRLQTMLGKWRSQKHCKKRDLESLVGYLQDASKVIRSGRTFTRRLIDLLKANHHRAHSAHIRLNVEARSDIAWWHTFIQHWNGLSMMTDSRIKHPDISICSDASGSWGCGAYWGDSWFQHQWSPSTHSFNITIKELFPIVIAAATWGHQWVNKSVCCHCDNEAVVHIINNGTSRDPIVMSLMRCLHFIAAKFNLLLSSTHLSGAHNTLADALSRNNASLFLSCCPQAHKQPSQIPPALMALLLHSKLDWTSPSWSKMFNSIFSPQLPLAQCAPTPPASGDTQHSAPSTISDLTQPTKTLFASSSLSLGSKTSNTRQSNATFRVSGSTTSCSLSRTHLPPISHDSNTSCEVSKAKRPRQDAPNTHGCLSHHKPC